MSPGHKEALAHLLYGLKEASGFVVITGEVGTGKTTILNAFLLKLPPRMPKVVVKNPHLKPENLYYLLGESIGVPEEKRSRDYINLFEDRLKEIGGAVLIVDESQGLSLEMLEEIRLLSNLETTNEKLVQIMLLGQQGAQREAQEPPAQTAQAADRDKVSHPAFDSNETKDYIDHRLRVAGTSPEKNRCSRCLPTRRSTATPRDFGSPTSSATACSSPPIRRTTSRSLLRWCKVVSGAGEHLFAQDRGKAFARPEIPETGTGTRVAHKGWIFRHSASCYRRGGLVLLPGRG